MGASTFWRPKTLPRPVMGQLVKVKEYNVMTKMIVMMIIIIIIIIVIIIIIIIVPISKARNLYARKVRLGASRKFVFI
jgi:hypothetical protein